MLYHKGKNVKGTKPKPKPKPIPKPDDGEVTTQDEGSNPPTVPTKPPPTNP